MSAPDPMVVAIVTALGLNGECGERTVHQAFLEGIEQELGCMQVDLYECDQPTRANALGQVCDRIRAFLQAEPQIIAYGREFYRGDPATRAAGDAPRSTPPTAPSDEARATEQLSKAALGVAFPRDPATLDAIEAHEHRIVEAVTPAIREACEDLGSAMAFVTSNADVFTDREVRGALLDLLQQINANVWSVKGELGIDVFRGTKATPKDTEVTQ